MIVRQRLPEGDSVLAEHHFVNAHTRISRSVLREGNHEYVSFLASNSRLYRLRTVQAPDIPLTFESEEGDALEALSYENIAAIRICRKRRQGEAIAGAGIIIFALLFKDVLQFTGSAMIILGIAGIAHAFLWPFRWVELMEKGGSRSYPFCIMALGKKSAKQLLKLLREKTGIPLS